MFLKTKTVVSSEEYQRVLDENRSLKKKIRNETQVSEETKRLLRNFCGAAVQFKLLHDKISSPQTLQEINDYVSGVSHFVVLEKTKDVPLGSRKLRPGDLFLMSSKNITVSPNEIQIDRPGECNYWGLMKDKELIYFNLLKTGKYVAKNDTVIFPTVYINFD